MQNLMDAHTAFAAVCNFNAQISRITESLYTDLSTQHTVSSAYHIKQMNSHDLSKWNPLRPIYIHTLIQLCECEYLSNIAVRKIANSIVFGGQFPDAQTFRHLSLFCMNACDVCTFLTVLLSHEHLSYAHLLWPSVRQGVLQIQVY